MNSSSSSFPAQVVRLCEFTDAAFDLSGALSGAPGDPPLLAQAQCFAFRASGLSDHAAKPWHQQLVEMAVVGLWEEKSTKAAYVCYTLHPQVVRLFFCSRAKRFPTRFHAFVSRKPGFIESGLDGFPPAFARGLAYWEPPCTVNALWPTGSQGESDGERAIDAGNLAAWFSYPASVHDQGVAIEKAGPDYLRVPRDEVERFSYGGREYHCFNRWEVLDRELAMA